ncbi:hypothetical protein SAMN05443575_2620 [Jatrophihabitans endophyticus]|uniref:Uncharacterized protein n=1 Tax=Jatrophihabitans endophyticus TaxID=1206085 RepID=A0A1M5M564_9ACTN|nr:hypothetical protein [Jatrophihabitans endophyticus]SHG71843.1 hypothetical protein SAMN05443575_2620 [Jatrophihabitans endophyticus]
MTSGESRGGAPRHHRPALFADLTEMIDAAGGDASPSTRAEVAAATAAAVVTAGRGPGDDDLFVALADHVGLDTLAALWRDSDPVSLPGALWTLYVLRQWCHGDSAGVTRLWRTGEPLAPADAAVAGLPDYADEEAVRRFADAVLGGLYRRDLAVALERAAAFFRVVATGRRAAGDSGGTGNVGDSVAAGAPERTGEPAALADRNERAAASLGAAARLWRAGALH